MKYLFLLLSFSFCLGQSGQSIQYKYAESITEQNLKDLLYTYASDEFGGRETGKETQEKALNFLKDFYKKNNITGANKGKYAQKIKKLKSENIIAYIPGSEKPDEYIILSAHLDHLGTKKGNVIYNGADDDGSGTVALLEIAKAFKKAADDGHPPYRSIVFLHFTGEEKGLLGSNYYSENPVFEIKNTVVDLNVDMIGRIDPERKGNINYVYLIGSNRLSTELHDLSEQVNKKCCQIELDYTYNNPKDPNRFYYRSDHYNFAKHRVPVIFYFNGVHEDYHKPTDTPDKINYELLRNRTELIFNTAWQLANQPKRIKVDKKRRRK